MLNFLKNKFKDLFNKKISFDDFEINLLEAGVSLEVVDLLRDELENEEDIKEKFKKLIEERVKEGKIELNKKPFIILVLGLNGAGKTTTIAKLAKYFLNKNKKVVLAAADTFRAGAIEQLEKHANNLGIELIKQKYGADAAAVAYDAIEHAKAKDIDVVLIDTSGRVHKREGLMRELEKLKRVAKPDLTLAIIDATVGNDAVEQTRKFGELADGFIITKFDADSRGGSLLSIALIGEKPIYFLGTGQNYEDLIEFNKNILLEAFDL